MITLRSAGFAGLVLMYYCVTADALAQSEVTLIQVDGQEVRSAAGIRVAAPKQQPRLGEVNTGDSFPQGTVIETPAKTVLELSSLNGNTLRIEARSKIRLAASANGESYTAFAGKVWFTVKKRLNFFNVSDSRGKIQGAVKATKFSVEVGEKAIKFEKTEGEVALQRKVQVKIADAKSSGERQRSRDLTTTKIDYLSADASELSYALDYYETDVVEFETYEGAEQYFRQQLEHHSHGSDREQLADDYTTLGYVYLDQGSPGAAVEYFNSALEINRQLFPGGIDPILADNYTDLGYAYLDLSQPKVAVKYFQEALAINEQIDPEDPLIAESYINLADALAEAGEDEAAQEYLRDAIAILELDLEINLEDFRDASTSDDPEDLELAWYIALDIVDNYENLGWAWEIAGDEERADRYYDQAEALEAQLGE